MHGRPRKSSKEEDAKSCAAKASNLQWLQSKLLYYHHHYIYTEEAIDISTKLLQINPDFYTLWNYRKLAVEHKLKISSDHPDSLNSIIDSELKAVDLALKLNFKSYGAWHHRRWILGKIPNTFLESEMRILNQFQKLDPRNFHAWNHRRFVTSLRNLDSGEEELEFTTTMINSNFSNYSAWHNRSVILSDLIDKKADGFYPGDQVFSSELDLVHQALFTDPDDQSAWFYYFWILRQILNSNIVVLVSSWPDNASTITTPPLIPSVHDSISVPLILRFSHVVEGVNVNTVKINSLFVRNNDVIWRPVSSISSRASPSWGCLLNFPRNSSINHLVQVTVGFSKGIVSISGSEYTCSSVISFTLCVEPKKANPKQHGDDYVNKLFEWSEEPFDSSKISEDLPNGVASFDRSNVVGDEFKNILDNEISLFRELLSEANCKFAKFSMARLLANMIQMVKWDDSTHCLQEVFKLYGELVKMDTCRAGYYKDEGSLVVGRDMGHFMNNSRRCVGKIEGVDWILMRDLSLSCIGGIERMLWVEVLDLGKNKIRSIEGIEALQLLKCLNLSYNKIGSFSTLGPLVLLKSLRVLNISHNEIRSHSVDSTRFLYSSIISRGHCFPIGDEGDYGYAEAHVVFKGMNLKQLDVDGNPVSSLKLKRLLVDIIPGIEWIDGENILL